jgi:predicted SprT family Zn-dependent metalloprotease
MNRADILTLARTEMNKHGLVHWTVQFINSKSVAGLCWTRRWNADPARSFGRIELSWDFFEVFEDRDILETIRHEIAHALTDDEYVVIKTGPRKGRKRRVVHGATWKANARRIGAVGHRCVRAEAKQPEGRYKGVCPSGHVSIRHRLTWQAKHNTSCAQCDPKVFSREHMFDWYDNGVLIHSQSKTLQKV